MSSYSNYGFFYKAPRKLIAVASVGAILSGTGSAYALDNLSQWERSIKSRVPFEVNAASARSTQQVRADARTISEHVENIRNTLNPTVADLALVFNISRQAIYKWLSGASSPEDDKVGSIVKLSQIADAFRNAGISRAWTMLKMKAFEGKSLLDLLREDSVKKEHIDALIAEAKSMELSLEKSGLVT